MALNFTGRCWARRSWRRVVPRAAPHRGDRASPGFALPVVLLLLAALSVAALVVFNAARSTVSAGRMYREEAIMRHAADGGYEVFLARYEAAGRPLLLEPFTTRIGEATVTVVSENERGKIDLNFGEPPLLLGLLKSLGMEGADSAEIVDQILAFRGTSNEGVFHDVDDLLQLASVDRALVSRLRPFVTVYNGSGRIDPFVAPAGVLQAVPGIDAETAARIAARPGIKLDLDQHEALALQASLSQSRPVYRVNSEAVLANGARFVREAVVDLTEREQPTLLVRERPILLLWRRGYSRDALAGAGGE